MDEKIGEQENAVLDTAAAWQEALPVLEQVWGGIFETTNNMLKVHTDFGFALFEKKLNPNIDKILLSLNVLKQILDTMYDSKELSFEEARMALNAIQQVVRVQRVAGALKANCEADYEAAMDEIAKQAFI